MFYFMTIICENRLEKKFRMIAIFVIIIVLKSSRNNNFQVWRPIFFDLLENLVHETFKFGP